MIVSPQSSRMTAEEYLVWEPKQALRYEYCDGQVFVMTGGTKGHNRLALNLYSALVDKVDDSGCEINTSDVKVLVKEGNAYRYPDLVVSCDERDKREPGFYQFPQLMVEVLSSRTKGADRFEKYKEYTQLPSLQAYLLISSDCTQIECFRRGEGRIWLYFQYGASDVISLESLGIDVPVDLIYENVKIETNNKI
ncbi:MAG: Uma2 family endonuclease [Cyanobacteria bacterium P01_C01_bin.69]